ncbi:MAG: bifunctional riboflavin kinase/FAD synthetase [Clostridia bacterium]|nr:bifunctional riboflavin kinase/FAD synthetase [Clostridia bacterium]
MIILNESNLPLRTPVAMTIGFFDGVHKGHSELLETVLEQPQPSLVYTFTRKPNVPKPLFTNAEREALMAEAGVDYYFAQNFDGRIEHESPRRFLQQLMRDFKVAVLVVGSDFRFGSGASGDVDLLEEMSGRFGYLLIVVPVVGEGRGKYSSSELRTRIRSGDLGAAREIMGRPYFIDGTVAAGSHLGSRIGFPTANISSDKLMPAYGVYATLTRTPDGLFPSVTNVGTKPTVKHDNRVNVETNLLDHSEDLYGKPIRVYFVERLRPEQEFASVEDLRRQISRDAARTRELFADAPPEEFVTG